MHLLSGCCSPDLGWVSNSILISITIFLYTQLLDCFGIPVLMALSWFILRARYRLIHFVAVAICLLGVGAMVGADILAGRNESEGKESFIVGGMGREMVPAVDRNL